MNSAKKFRVGQRVQLASDPSHTFIIDKSLVPDRIYREKGTGNFWTKNELQPFGAAENPHTSIRLNGKAGCAAREITVTEERLTETDANTLQERTGMRSLAFSGVSGEQFTESRSGQETETRSCRECGAEFAPSHPRQKFCSGAHRTRYWKRTKPAMAITPSTAVA